MIRITKEADYGIMLLAVLADNEPGEIHTAREVGRVERAAAADGEQDPAQPGPRGSSPRTVG